MNILNLKKKGLVYRTIFYLIIFLVILVIIIGYQATIFTYFNDDAPNYECITSIEAGEVLTQAGLPNVPLQCKTQTFIIDHDLSSEQGQTDTKREIADEMVNCWDKFRRGNIELFEKSGSFCNVCAVFQFSKENQGKELKGLPLFMVTESPSKSKVTYQDYLSNFEKSRVRELVADTSKFPADQLDASESTKNSKSVIFLYVKGKEEIEKMGEKIGLDTPLEQTVGGGVAGGAAGLGIVILVGATAGVGALIIGAGAIVGGVIGFLANQPDPWFSMTIYKEFTGPELLSLGCESLV